MKKREHGSTWPLYRRLLAYARPYGLQIAIGILAGLLNGSALFGMFQVSGHIIRPFETTAVETVAAAEGPEETLPGELDFVERAARMFGISLSGDDGGVNRKFIFVVCILLPLFAGVRALVIYINAYTMRWVGARIVRDLRDDAFDSLQGQSLKFFGKTDIGGLISRCTNDMTSLESIIATLIGNIARAPLEIVAAVTFVILSAREHNMVGMVSLMIVVFPLCIVPIILLGHVIRRQTRRALGKIADLVSRMHENFTCVRVVKAFDMETRETGRFREMNRSYFRTVIRALRAELLITPVVEFAGLMLTVVFIVMCYARGIQLSQIMPVCLAAVAAYRPLKQLARLNVYLQRGAPALERIYGLLDVDTSIPEASNPVPLTQFEDRVIFDDVKFAYDEESEPVLKGVQFEIPCGSVVACVGETGSGKTTMANLLARFYDPTDGRISLDGHDLRDVEIASLRRLVSIVTQDTILFNDTIAYNISYGSDSASHEQIIEAAKQANAHEFIVADAAGYERVVGEKGFVLSGGERQRLALARAILRNSPILILDEATSALDTVTERLIQEAISRVMRNRTVFAIAHRLSTVRHADLILLMEKGSIVERGTHEELYESGGHYRKLCDMQVLDSP